MFKLAHLTPEQMSAVNTVNFAVPRECHGSFSLPELNLAAGDDNTIAAILAQVRAECKDIRPGDELTASLNLDGGVYKLDATDETNSIGLQIVKVLDKFGLDVTGHHIITIAIREKQTATTTEGDSRQHVVGIFNGANFCYMNSALQLIFSLPEFQRMIRGLSDSKARPAALKRALDKYETALSSKDTFIKIVRTDQNIISKRGGDDQWDMTGFAQGLLEAITKSDGLITKFNLTQVSPVKFLNAVFRSDEETREQFCGQYLQVNFTEEDLKDVGLDEGTLAVIWNADEKEATDRTIAGVQTWVNTWEAVAPGTKSIEVLTESAIQTAKERIELLQKRVGRRSPLPTAFKSITFYPSPLFAVRLAGIELPQGLSGSGSSAPVVIPPNTTEDVDFARKYLKLDTLHEIVDGNIKHTLATTTQKKPNVSKLLTVLSQSFPQNNYEKALDAYRNQYLSGDRHARLDLLLGDTSQAGNVRSAQVMEKQLINTSLAWAVLARDQPDSIRTFVRQIISEGLGRLDMATKLKLASEVVKALDIDNPLYEFNLKQNTLFTNPAVIDILRKNTVTGAELAAMQQRAVEHSRVVTMESLIDVSNIRKRTIDDPTPSPTDEDRFELDSVAFDEAIGFCDLPDQLLISVARLTQTKREGTVDSYLCMDRIVPDDILLRDLSVELVPKMYELKGTAVHTKLVDYTGRKEKLKVSKEGGGHYVAYLKQNNVYYKANDEVVTTITKENFQDNCSRGSLFLYVRKHYYPLTLCVVQPPR